LIVGARPGLREPPAAPHFPGRGATIPHGRRASRESFAVAGCGRMTEAKRRAVLRARAEAPRARKRPLLTSALTGTAFFKRSCGDPLRFIGEISGILRPEGFSTLNEPPPRTSTLPSATVFL